MPSTLFRVPGSWGSVNIRLTLSLSGRISMLRATTKKRVKLSALVLMLSCRSSRPYSAAAWRLQTAALVLSPLSATRGRAAGSQGR